MHFRCEQLASARDAGHPRPELLKLPELPSRGRRVPARRRRNDLATSLRARRRPPAKRRTIVSYTDAIRIPMAIREVNRAILVGGRDVAIPPRWRAHHG